MAVNKVRRNGSYAPLSAHYYKDDALAEAGEAAELLFVRGLAFCADVLSDGFISDLQLVRFVGVGMKDAPRRAKRLCDVGSWERVENGYRVRSWLDWNRSKAEIVDYQQKDKQRKAKGASDEPDSAPPDPDPPSGFRAESDWNPNGFLQESGSDSEASPNGFQPRARTPLHSTPRNSSSSSSDPAAPTSDKQPVDEPQRDDVDALCNRLRDWMIQNEAKTPTITKEWRRQARLMLDKDKRELSKALNLIDWCQQDTFWMANIHSIPTFREKYDKLAMRAREEWRANADRAKTNADAADPNRSPWADVQRYTS